MILSMKLLRAALVAGVVLWAGGEAAAQTVPPTAPGLVWYGKQSGLGLADVATIAAPVLWFSTEEPLLLQGDRNLPRVHPCDTPSSGPVAYYQVTRIRLRSGVK